MCRCYCFACDSAVWPYTVQIVKFFKVILKKTYQGNLYPMEVDFKPNEANPADPVIGDFSVGCAVGVDVVSDSIGQLSSACVPCFAQQVSGGFGWSRHGTSQDARHESYSRYVAGFTRALIIHSMLTIAIDLQKEFPPDSMAQLKELLASMYSIQCTFKPRSRKETLIEQIGPT
jgi:hypothetical protein